MADSGTNRRTPWVALLAIARGFLSFRVGLALVTSTVVTTAVAGPMAYQASQARDLQGAAAALALDGQISSELPPRVTPPGPTNTADPSAKPNSNPDPDNTTTTAPDETTDPANPNATSTTTLKPGATTTVKPRTTTTVADPTTTGTGTNGSTSTSTTAPGMSAAGLWVTIESDRTPYYQLDSATVRRTVNVFFDAPSTRSVKFYLDKAIDSGVPSRTATAAPFELLKGGFNFSTVPAGTHRLMVEVTTTSGSTYRRLATFEVIR